MSVRDVISIVTKMYTRVQQTTSKMKPVEFNNEIDNVVFLGGAIPFGVCSRELRDVAVNTCLRPLVESLPVVGIPEPLIFYAKLYLASTWLHFAPGISHSVNELLQHPEWLSDYGISITKEAIEAIDTGVQYEYDQMLAEFCNNHCISLVLEDAGTRLPRGRVHTVAESFTLYLDMVEALWDEINQDLAFNTARGRQRPAPGGDKMVTRDDTAKVYFVTHLVFVANAWGTADLWLVNFSRPVRRRLFDVLCRWFQNIFERDAIHENAEIFYEINYALMYLLDDAAQYVEYDAAHNVEYDEHDDDVDDDGDGGPLQISDLPENLWPLFQRNLDLAGTSALHANLFMPSVIVGNKLTVDYHIHDIMAFYFSEGCRLFILPLRPATRICDFTESTSDAQTHT